MLEYIPETLHGPLSPGDALVTTHQISEALGAANEKGIVKITPKGKVKVLDVGLAKAPAGDAPAEMSTHPPTLTVAAMTRTQVLLGTAADMSESGRSISRRGP